MDFSEEYTSNVYNIPIENIGKYHFEVCWICWVWFEGDLNAVERANQVKPSKEEPNEKMLQAQARRQRRLDGLQRFEKTKMNRYANQMNL